MIEQDKSFFDYFIEWMFIIGVLSIVGLAISYNPSKELNAAEWSIEKKIEVWSTQSDLSREIQAFNRQIGTEPDIVPVLPLILNTGDEKEVAFVSFSSAEGYSIATTSDSGELSWTLLGFPDDTFTVMMDDFLSHSRLMRHENHVEITEYSLPSRTEVTAVDYQYTLFIKKSDLNGDSFERSCGKNCTERVDETIF